MKKRRPEILQPGLKQLTPLEKKMVERMNGENRLRWHNLLLLNKWKPSK